MKTRLLRVWITTAVLAGCKQEAPAKHDVAAPPDSGPRVVAAASTTAQVEQPIEKYHPFVDVAAVSPDVYQVLQEADWVRILQGTIKPGHKDRPHSHPESFVYAITAVTGKEQHVGAPGGEAVSWSEGQTLLRPAVDEYSFENTGKKEARFLVFELDSKPPKSEPTRDAAIDPVQVSPDHFKVLAETDQLRLMLLDYKARTKDKTHSLRRHVTYTLSGGKGRFHFGAIQDVTLEKGATLVQPAFPSVSFENVGTSEIKVVMLELKN